MTFIIVNWMDTITYMDLGIVHNEDGEPMLFERYREASEYVEKELNGESRIVPIH